MSSVAADAVTETLIVDALGPHRGTLVWLHGMGDTPAHFKTVFDMMRLKGVWLVVPPAPIIPVSAFNEKIMPSWFDMPRLPSRTDGSRPHSATLSRCLARALPP